jgi:hypothetical protein
MLSHNELQRCHRFGDEGKRAERLAVNSWISGPIIMLPRGFRQPPNGKTAHCQFVRNCNKAGDWRTGVRDGCVA